MLLNRVINIFITKDMLRSTLWLRRTLQPGSNWSLYTKLRMDTLEETMAWYDLIQVTNTY